MSEHDNAYYFYGTFVNATRASFVNYVEGIYVGYRYYETAAAKGFIDYDATDKADANAVMPTTGAKNGVKPADLRGMVITDYFGMYGYQNADQQIRNGNDGRKQ